MRYHLKVGLLVPALLACSAAAAVAAGPGKPPTVAEAQAFMDQAEGTLLDLGTFAGRADWIKSNFITEDTELVAAREDERAIAATVDLTKRATRFDKLQLPPELARKFKLLKVALTLATPADPNEASELTRIVTSMEGTYGRGKYCPGGDQSKCLDLEDITRIMATSRDPNQLLDVWRGWHSISPPMRQEFARYVELGNKGASELGFADMGAMWRSKYDMPPDAFAQELDRLWEQVRPLYVSLHAYVRSRLREKYGAVAADWESGAIAWTAARNSMPCLILRAVSDLVDPAGGEVYDDYAEFERRSLEIMRALLAVLPAWLTAWSHRPAGWSPRQTP